MSQFAVWQSRPVFVTSTFRDMQAERDHLRDSVFPRLAERLRARFHHLEPIDLRWGVETASLNEQQAKEMLVLKVCLAEIKRSRPFLIALIGDRYGWLPPEERIRAAADEAGFRKDVRGKSVTALEIEYGILDSEEQRRLSRFYFREPLPYDEMDDATAAEYCDLKAGPEGKDAHQRLEALKERIRREMPSRWRPYRAGWDQAAKTVIGLDAWGDEVLEDVWTDLEFATRDYAHATLATWQQEEAWVLEQFTEEKTRDFVGRLSILGQLRGVCFSPTSEAVPWGCCVTGEAGSGKSSLLAKLARELVGQDVVLLTHAAGISSRSSQVDLLLRRWTGELAANLGEADPSEPLTRREDLEKTFAEMLSRVAVTRRVVCLIDAVNQFERMPAARHLTWLPKLWPANARLVVTAIGGSESKAMIARHGCHELALPALNEREVVEIVRTVCARYHKELNERARDLLLTKRLPDGRPSAGIPLWLELAVEELLLLDMDDFARADREFRGSAEERLLSLLTTVVERLPPGVEDLCCHVLERSERLHGREWVRAFAELLALSRTGWRESDFETMLPAVTGVKWDPLRFAALRRSFRGQLVQRGASGQWDFSHAQMREAVLNGIPERSETRQSRHGAMATYLSGLPTEDPLRQTELMVHLIRADHKQAAAALYGGPLQEVEQAGATAALAAYIGEGSESGSELELQWVLRLAEEKLEPGGLRLLCVRWSEYLIPALADVAPVGVSHVIAAAVVQHMEELRRRVPDSADYARNLAVSYSKLGDLTLAMGDPQKAMPLYGQFQAIMEELRRRVPDSADYARNLAVSYSKLGDLTLSMGDPQEARALYRKYRAISEELRRRAPDSIEHAWDLAMSYSKLGDVALTMGDLQGARALYEKDRAIWEGLRRRVPESRDYARNLAVSYSKLGDVALTIGDLQEARTLYEKDQAISQELRRRAPDSIDYARNLARSHSRLGDLVRMMGHTQEARLFFDNAREIMEELWRRAPDSVDSARDLAVSYANLGDLALATGNPREARALYEKDLAIMEKLKSRAPDSVDYARDLAVSYGKLGAVGLAMGNPQEARDSYDKARSIGEELRKRVPDSAHYAKDLGVTYSKLGDVAQAIGDLQEARDLYEKDRVISEELSRRSPGSTDDARGLAVSYSRLGDLARATGDPQEARALYEKGIGVFEELRRRAPDRTDYARDLAASYSRLGDLAGAMGHTPDALILYDKAREIMEALSTSDTADDARDLGVIYSKLGGLALAMGEPQEAKALYGNAQKIGEQLMKRAPDTADDVRDLGVTYSKVGDVAQAMGDLREARDLYEKGIGVCEELRRRAPDRADYARDLAASYSRLGDLALAMGDPQEARALYGKPIGVFEEMRRSSPNNADCARNLAIAYSRFADFSLKHCEAQQALQFYRRFLALLDDMQQNVPGFVLDPGESNAVIRAEYLRHIQSTAVALSNARQYSAAEEALLILLDQQFEVPWTRRYLACLYLLTGRETEAADAVREAWAQRDQAPPYVVPRILFLQAILALLAGGDPRRFLARIKGVLGPKDAHAAWTIGPVLDHLAARLPPRDLAFLRKLAAALGDAKALPELDGEDLWRVARVGLEE
jgi:tetratricopeptide (TPR) repeat protein